jgi:ABC-type polysaccharide/polyol phosphate transport system ATPase subunit
MNTDTIIKATGVSKKFCRSLKRTMLYGIRDVTTDMLRLSQTSNRLRRDEFWALNDVSFEIKRGECVGLIGPNGAGKSTLLKLVNGITLPDKGSVAVKGRIGALLELGAGFHPLLTGRENIHLSGAILGFSKAQMAEKFDSIVDFAGLEEFIDSPVKQYSTGMYVRLGFAVAISSEPEILIVDESIAVGDMAFRNRCLDRISAFIKAGKTIIVVSHNLQEIEKITGRVLLLDHGVIRDDGRPDEVISSYMNLLTTRQLQERWKGNEIDGTRRRSVIEIVEVEVCGNGGEKRNYFRTHDELSVGIKFIAYQPIVNPVFRVQIFRNDGLFCHGMNTERHGIDNGEVCGEGTIVLRYTDLSLLGGDYSVYVAVLSSQYDAVPLHQMTTSISIHLESQMVDGAGVVAMPTEWTPIAG